MTSIEAIASGDRVHLSRAAEEDEWGISVTTYGTSGSVDLTLAEAGELMVALWKMGADDAQIRAAMDRHDRTL